MCTSYMETSTYSPFPNLGLKLKKKKKGRNQHMIDQE